MTNAPCNGGPDARRQLASLPLGVVLLQPGMRIASVNPVAEQFFGQSSRRLIGLALTELITFNEARVIEQLSDSETPFSARELDVSIVGLGHRRIDLTAAPVADFSGWQLLSMQDNGALEAFGADSGSADDTVLRGPEILAHEIKNPLAGIRGAAQLLARKLKDKDRALTDLITSEVDRVAGLIERMQLLSGKTTLPVAPCNLHEIIRRAIAVLEAGKSETETEVAIREEFDPSLPPVLGEPDGLVQVLINLLANAREACSGQTAPEIFVRTRFSSGLQLRSANSGKSVRLSVEIRVSDNGPGVPANLREHLFEPFVTTKKNGQGLGLALVRKLVRDMNGRISHERDEDMGLTHFRVHLPLAAARQGKPRESEGVT
ncbi:MAG: PAS domain-containing sensor histidine kinase [Sphingomonadaceae bacterium]|nr:PAS domain-containing sensor histidine kinase [Sphingomonadaceae bacterium]